MPNHRPSILQALVRLGVKSGIMIDQYKLLKVQKNVKSISELI